jgi:hypothetical protein
MRGAPMVAVTISLSRRVVAAARNRAAAAEVPLRDWLAEAVEVVLAGERCNHAAPAAAPQSSELDDANHAADDP